MEDMTEEEAWTILAPYFKKHDTREIEREVAKKLAESKSERDEAIAEAERIRSEYLKEKTNLTPTKEGPIFCKKCHKLAYTLRLKGGIKIMDSHGKTIMDYGENVSFIGNSFGFKCNQCGADIKIVT